MDDEFLRFSDMWIDRSSGFLTQIIHHKPHKRSLQSVQHGVFLEAKWREIREMLGGDAT